MNTLDSRASVRSWGAALARAVLGALALLALVVAAVYAFVALYSHVMEPGRDLAYYQEFAQQTGPPFATVLGFFVTYLVAQRLASGAANPWPRALLLVAASEALEALMYAGMGAAGELLALPHLLAAFAKLVGAALAALSLQTVALRRARAAASPSRA
jgi:hypothetical protein